MRILVIDNHTKDLEELKKLLDGLDFEICSKEDFSVGMAEPFDIVILSGGSGVRSAKNHSEDYKIEIDFIKNTDKKIIGICLGCQIVSLAFGCTLKELEGKEEGIVKINYLNNEYYVYDSHKFGIENISNEIEVLATSKDGIEIIRHKTKPIWGMQFHPEVHDGGNNGAKIFMEILENI